MATFTISTSSVRTQSARRDDHCRPTNASCFLQSMMKQKNTNVNTNTHMNMAMAMATIKRFNLSTVKATSGNADLSASTASDEPISLGTVKIPDGVNLGKLEAYLYQWGTSLTQNANLPLPLPLKVDKIQGGVRLGYIRLVDGAIKDLLHIDCVVYPASADSSAIFRALRKGPFKDQVPPGEQIIMQSLLQALRKSIQLSRV